jgi:hypothetical protein
MPAYLFNAPAGFIGDVTRPDESNVEPAFLVGVGTSPPVYPAAFGLAMKYVAGGLQQFNGGAETAPSFAGILIREVPQQGSSLAPDAQSTLTADVPNPVQTQGLLVRGYALVQCTHGTPARGGVVYVQIVADTAAIVGSFRADGTDGSNAIALTATQAEWASDGVDANGFAEIRISR